MTASALSSQSKLNDYGFPFRMFKGHVFVMLTMCFDGSGSEDDLNSTQVTLAAFAGEQDAWDCLNAEWESSLKQHGASYMHMYEANMRREEFEGWTDEELTPLVTSLATIPAKVKAAYRFQAIRFTVDAAAYRKWATPHIPTITTNLAIGAFTRLFMWYAASPKAILDPMAILFDRNEPYMNILMQRWNRRKSFKGKRPWWDLITTIAPVDMRKVPGVQAADMLAWSINRARTRAPGASDWGDNMARVILGAIPHVWNEVEETHFRKVKLTSESF
jgi:Protein of unknown function (DUF3800)